MKKLATIRSGCWTHSIASAVCLAGLLANLAVSPTLAETGITNIINGVTNSIVGDYAVGSNGAFNTLTITNAGVLNVSSWASIGASSISSNNSVLVTGVGSVWGNGELRIGRTGSFNSLTIASGGLVSNNSGTIGAGLQACGNTVIVTGPGSVWSNKGDLSVGQNGSGNSVTITDGGLVFNNYGDIGGSGNNNTMFVTGPGSVWSNRAVLTVGSSGSGNSMTIANSGQVVSTSVYLGDFGSSNTVLVTGPGSVWQHGGLGLGQSGGASNSLTIADGGQVISDGVSIGNSFTTSNNAVVVTGSGSVWSTGQMGVGADGYGNSLTIANGGQVLSSQVSIGSRASATNSAVLVTGAGSVWQTGNLLIGRIGSASRLTINDSGLVIATNAIVGATSTSTGNLLTVSGGNLIVTNTLAKGTLEIRRGTLMLNSGTVTVNRLIATNGASSVVDFNGGLLRSGGTTVSNGTQFIVGDGTSAATLDLLGGTHSFANGLLLSSNANLIGSGTLIGSMTNFGGISPGHSVGLLAITGDLALMDSSVLDMEITGLGTNDHIDTTGLLKAGGWLNVSFTNGYAPAKGEMFDLFGFGAATNSFAGITLPTFQYAETDWDTTHLLAPASDPLSGSIIFIPEPGTCALTIAGVLALTRRRRRGNRSC